MSQELRIALVSDFYFPNQGGVQVHIRQLASLLSRKFYVIVITHQRPKYEGIMKEDNFTVYYLPLAYIQSTQMIYPTFIFNFKKAKQILKRERINLVHCHQSCSPLALQYIFFAKKLKIKVVLTEHSLIGFKSLIQIHYNGFFSVILPFVDKIIAVSRTTKNNIILRANIEPRKVTVIPNGVRKLDIKGGKTVKKEGTIKILSVGRLVYRRGTDLLIEVLPQICELYSNIQIYIIGGGTKFQLLKVSVEKNALTSRIFLLGPVPNQKVLQIMQSCDIFLNTAITESFGIALVEAASLGLHCVSTNVGSIPEILPSEVLTVVEPQVPLLVQALSKQIDSLMRRQFQPTNKYKNFGYDWNDCSQRIEQLYLDVRQTKEKEKHMVKELWDRGLLGLLFIFCYIIIQIIDLVTEVKRKGCDKR